MERYDVIIVGARVAGASLAINLGNSQLKVLVLDRAEVIRQDTLSTHFLWPRGVSYLNRLGVLEKVLRSTPKGEKITFCVEGIELQGNLRLEKIQERFRKVHGDDRGVVGFYLSPRRKILDTILLEEAKRCGVQVKTGFQVKKIDNGIVEGVHGGQFVQLKADVIVGADGKNSFVGKDFPKMERRDACTFACYTYVEGLSTPNARIERMGRLGMGIVPTSNNAHMVLVYGPNEFAESFEEDKEQNFFKTLELINPKIAVEVRLGKRVEGFYYTQDQKAFNRSARRGHTVLLGDAVSFKDQCTASGMTHALRDAELLSEELRYHFCKHKPLDEALEDYADRRFQDSHRYYDFVCQQAEMKPASLLEKELFFSMKTNLNATNMFLEVMGDVVSPKEFHAERNIKAILSGRLHPLVKEDSLDDFRNPYSLEMPESFSLKNQLDFHAGRGVDLLKRTKEYYSYVQDRKDSGTFQFSRTLLSRAGPQMSLQDDRGGKVTGVNFASQDYLALSQHPSVIEAAKIALRDFGLHSAGSPMVIGNTPPTRTLEKNLGEFLHMNHVLLYPTGWAAGFGAVTSFVRAQDYVVMDRLTHQCLQQGAYASTKNVYKHPHLDLDSVRSYLKMIRSNDCRNGIMVISEGIFSMDADAPDLLRLQDLCHEYEATLLVDVAHDLGALGPKGTGQLGLQGALGKIDLVMGSFSKTFGSNGGFLMAKSPEVIEYAKMFGGSHMFSNALSPVQASVVNEALRIVRSAEGDILRTQLLDTANHLRMQLASEGATALGQPCAIIPVMIGTEANARLAHREMQKKNIATMILEYPVVAIGAARFRLQIMANHTRADALVVAKAIGETMRSFNNKRYEKVD